MTAPVTTTQSNASQPTMTSSSDAQVHAFEAGMAAVVSAQEAAAASEVARASDTAALLAKIEENLAKQNEQNQKHLKIAMVEIVQDALGKEPTRYFDASRIPLICKSIFDMHEGIEEIRATLRGMTDYPVVRKVVFGMVGLILTGVMGSLLILILKK